MSDLVAGAAKAECPCGHGCAEHIAQLHHVVRAGDLENVDRSG